MDDHCRHVLQLRKSINYAFGDTERNRVAVKIYMLYYMVPCVIMYDIKADALWAMTDILSAVYVMMTLLFVFTQQKGNHAACKGLLGPLPTSI